MVASIVGGVAGMAGSYLAGEAQVSAAEEGEDTLRERERAASEARWHAQEQSLGLLKPWTTTELGAQNRMSEMFLGAPISGIDPETGEVTPGANGMAPDYSGFYKSPGYEFVRDEGLRAMDRGAAARGKLRGGGYGREVGRYAAGLASGEFNNYANRLAALAAPQATGASANIWTGTAAANTAALANSGAQIAGAQNLRGEARASQYAGMGNAATGALNNAMFFNQLGNANSMDPGAGRQSSYQPTSGKYGGMTPESDYWGR